MKLAVIGGAGVRTPLLVRGLCGSDLPIDGDGALRLGPGAAARHRGAGREYAGAAAITRLRDAGRGGGGRATSSSPASASGASRPARATRRRRWRTAWWGRRPSGPAGFAMAMRERSRTWSRCAREVARRAPRRVDRELHEPGRHHDPGGAQRDRRPRHRHLRHADRAVRGGRARARGARRRSAHFDYFGLNHLGWLREVRHRGAPQLHACWDDRRAACAAIYRGPLLRAERPARAAAAADRVRLLLLPPRARAREHAARGGQPRRGHPRAERRACSPTCAGPGANAVAVYEAYLAAAQRRLHADRVGRGRGAPRRRRPALTGYDRIAVSSHARHPRQHDARACR